MSAPTYFTAISGSRVDRERGIIEGVSVITEGEAKGHGIHIDSTTLQQVKQCADQFSDGVQVKIDHGTGFASIVGVLRNFRIDGSKLLADLHLLKNHEMRERLFEIAEEMPGSVGLSIAFSGKQEKGEGKKFARCEELYSVDFVDTPAANPSGLFKRVDSAVDSMADIVTPEKSLLEQIKGLLGMTQAPAPEPINFEAKSKDLETQLSAANAKLTEFAALQTKFSELEAAKLKAETEFAAKIADFDAKVEKAAADKAAAINASLGVPPAGSGGNGGEKKDFAALVQAKVAAEKCSKAKAVEALTKSNPAEYAEWRKSGNTKTL